LNDDFLQLVAGELNELFEIRQYSISSEYPPDQLVQDMLGDVVKRIGGFGVEGLVDYDKDIDCYYVNRGDPYKQTILYAFGNGGFTVDSWGDYIERKELEYEKEQREHDEQQEKTPEMSVEAMFGVPVAEPDIMPMIEVSEVAPPVKSILEEIDWPTPRSKVEQFRQDFTKSIIELMERGEAFWQKPWKTPEFGGLPVNAVTGKRYNGINIAYLMDASMRRGFHDPRWMTFLQAKEAGYHVNAGETGTKIEFYGEYDPKGTKKGREQQDERIQRMRSEGASQREIEKAQEEQAFLFVKTYTVFNAQQISGIEPLEVKIDGIRDESEIGYHERAEKIMDNCGVPFLYGNYYAAYNPLHDVIKMPERTWFNSDEFFYSTALHEVAHSTGHHSRMNRELIQEIGGGFGTPEYAMEELRAEMASAFLVMELGIVLKEEDAKRHTEQHAAYTKSWLSALKDDYKEFFKATRDAVNIADYVLAYEHVHEKDHVNSNANSREEIIAQATAAIGGDVIITSAERGKSYTGEIVAASAVHAVQKIAPGRGIVHNFTQLDLPQADENRPITISYDRDGNGQVRESMCDAAHAMDIAERE